MSQDFFQCLLCSTFFENLWKVEKHIKQHQNDSDYQERRIEACERRRGMLPIKKVTFSSCYVQVVKNQIDPNFLQQYCEVQAKEEPELAVKLDIDPSDYLALQFNEEDDDGTDDIIENEECEKIPKKRRSRRGLSLNLNALTEETQRPRRSRLKAAANIRRTAAVLTIPDQQDADEEQNEDMEFIQDLIGKLSDEDDDDFRPPTYLTKNYSGIKRKVGRPVGSLSKKATTKAIVRKRRMKRGKKVQIDESGLHPCEYCLESFHDKNDLYMHLYQNHQDEANMIVCPVLPCGRPYLNYFSLRDHLRLHSDAERKEYASKESTDDPSMTNSEHMEEVDQKPSIKALPAKSAITCKFCLRKFASFNLLQDHISADHSDTSILKCPLCEKDKPEVDVISFIGHLKGLHPERIDPYNERLAELEGSRKKEKRFKCDKCDAAFTFRYALNNHIQSHERVNKKNTQHENDPERRFTCPVCEKKFKYKDNLRRHFTLHLENNPYVCDFPDCNKKFNSDYNLRRHKALHSDSPTALFHQRVHCPICSASFSRRDKLPRHFREVHTPNDVDNTNPSKRRKYQARLPHSSRVRKFPTYKDLELREQSKEDAPAESSAIPTSIEKSEENKVVKTETVEFMSSEEIHLVDKIILGSDGHAVHVKGEHLSPEKVSINCLPKTNSLQTEQPAVSDTIAVNTNTLTKLITSDPVFERLSKEDPNKIKDVVTRNYNYWPDGKSFECSICEAVFSRAWTLQLHLQTIHKKTILDQKESTNESVESGDVEIENNITLMCGTCAYPAKNANDLAKHVKLSHKLKIKCPKCGLSFETQKRVDRHIQEIHSGLRKFQCKFCPRSFTQRGYLRAHERKVHDDSGKPKAMKRCPVAGCHRMLAASSYYSHVKRHDEKMTASERTRKHMCMLCQDTFAGGSSLRRHIDAIHLGKPINKRKKGQGFKEAGPPKNGVIVTRGPKEPGDEWFQPLLEKALGFTSRNESQGEAGKETAVPEQVDKEKDEDELASILGF